MNADARYIRRTFIKLSMQESREETWRERGYEPHDFAQVWLDHQDLFSSEARRSVRRALEEETDQRRRESWRRLLFALEQQYIDLGTARLHDRVSRLEYEKILEVNGRNVFYRDAPYIQATGEPIAWRETVGEEAFRYWRRVIAPKNRRALKIMFGRLRRLGVSHPWMYFEGLFNIPFWQLGEACRLLLKATEGPYRRHALPYLRRRFGVNLSGLGTGQLSYVFAMHNLDGDITVDPLERATGWFKDKLGMQIDKLPGLKIRDLEDRPRKSARPMCIPVDAPREVNLLIRPYQTLDDHATHLHEWMHTLHYCYSSDGLPWELRNLSRNDGVAETYAFLAEHLLQEPSFVIWYLKADPQTARRIAYASLVVGILKLRVLCAKFLFQERFFVHPFEDAFNQKAYTQLLRIAQPFRVEPLRYLEDAWEWEWIGYILGWLTSPRFRGYMRKTYGARWFLEREMGRELRRLFRLGDSIGVFDLAYRWGSPPWDIRAVTDTFAALDQLDGRG